MWCAPCPSQPIAFEELKAMSNHSSDFPLPDGACPVPDFPDYCITKNGDVYSRNVYGSKIRRKGPWWKMKPKWRKDRDKRYLYVDLFREPKKPERQMIHWLVLMAFVGPRPEGEEGRHLDDNSLNNNLLNLAWGTRKENVHDAMRNGKMSNGEGHSKNCHSMVEMTDEKVLEIRRLYKTGATKADIARRFGIRPARAHKLISRQLWKHLP